MQLIETQASKYRRMAKNAGMLYFRMLLTMVVTLYTSRVVLQTLGVEDFGIFNVVAGFVTMLGFLSGAMSSATQRFLAFEMGKSGKSGLSSVFSMSINIHILIATIVLILGETLGIWFVQTQMTIPSDRLEAAEWVFHLSLASFAVTIISAPYNALIIAHERMTVFAWVSVVDAILKLFIIFLLAIISLDKLFLYGVLTLLVIIVIAFTYYWYCHSNFKGVEYNLEWRQELFKDMVTFSGWSLWGNLSAVMSGQGVNVLLNIFFGPSINAARAISTQVSTALNSFVINIQAAINPQIYKSYAEKNQGYNHNLICYGVKYNYYVLLLITLPVLNNLELILNIWLVEVPESTHVFVRLAIYNILIDCLSLPLMAAAQASGRIKLYQFVVGGLLLLNIPISYYLLDYGCSAFAVYFVSISLSIIALLARVIIVSGLIDLRIKEFFDRAIIPVLLVTVSVFLINYYSSVNTDLALLEFCLSAGGSSVLIFMSVLVVGLEKRERKAIVAVFYKAIALLRTK